MSDLEKQPKQELIESLLPSLYQTDKEQVQSLVSAAMKRIDTVISERSSTGVVSNSRKGLPRWFSIAIAIAVLVMLVIYLPYFDSSRSAKASVSRSIEQAFTDIGRHYRVTLQLRMPDASQQSSTADLYVKGRQRFAIRTFGPVQKKVPFWIGSHPDRSWVVPPIGPVLEGNGRHLIEWAEEKTDLATPYLHISTALESMRDNYRLKSLAPEDLEVGGRLVRCHRVLGQLIGDSTQTKPDRFELWSDTQSGVAMQVIANWEMRDDEYGRESVLIQFQEDKELADDFFTPDHHGGDARTKISFSEEQQ